MPRKPNPDTKVDYWSLEPEFRAWLESVIERSKANRFDDLIAVAGKYQEEASRTDPAHQARLSARVRDVIQAAEDLVEARRLRKSFTRADEEIYRRMWEQDRQRKAGIS